MFASSRYFKTKFSPVSCLISDCASASCCLSNSIWPLSCCLASSADFNSSSINVSRSCNCEYRGASDETMALNSGGNSPRCPFISAACISEYSFPLPFISTINAKTSISSSVYMRVRLSPGLACGLRCVWNSMLYWRTVSRAILNNFAVWIAFHTENFLSLVTSQYQTVTRFALPYFAACEEYATLLNKVQYGLIIHLVQGGCNGTR
jgi:hypothetical protein